ncbi:MAG: aspartate-semialdehyde dehydrogenase [SAR202 cluster bacterium Io17-Chloro-G1]|nr:aspartate-semialdehyde dehydrogenase [Dehalococcoidia bacterium]MCD5400193.1 aspartate-semialdehyde dehydrogenase [Dehalococcoidia bacterium]PKB62963.1 MAG: aspartate-semialdehyde dehydrogenase [SAR202 cluster bacterium Io17-Chloro-G1]
MSECKIALIGATGAVGQVFLSILEERNFPASDIRLCASERSFGKKIKVRGEKLIVEEATPQLLSEVDFVFISASGSVSRQMAPIAVDRGAVVIDKSSAFRMDPNVPLVVPEINPGDLHDHHGIIASPNCTTTPMVMALKPLNEANPAKRIVAASYQSVTGTGASAGEELLAQSRDVLDGKDASLDVYPHQIAFNILPHVEEFLENGYTTEEMKMQNEARKILHAPDLKVSTTCVRVPVMISHAEAINVEFTDPMSPGEVREILSTMPGVRVVDDPQANVYPMPVQSEGEDDVFVGRIRKDISLDNGIAMWLTCDNLRKGAALNAIQIAEEMLARNLLQ